MSQNVVTLKSGSEATQGHWKLYHSIDWVRFPINGLSPSPSPSPSGLSNFVPRTLSVSFWDIRYGSRKVTKTDTDRSAAYNFLLTFHSNHGLSRTVTEINDDFSRKSQMFPIPCILRPHWRGSPHNWVSVLREKSRIMGPPSRTKSLTISSDVCMQSTNVTEGQTDGYRATAKTALTYSVAR